MADIPKLNKENLILHKTTQINKDYILGRTLGQGAFGQVRLAIHKKTKQNRAIKILKKSTENIEEVMNEIEILSKLTHPNIMEIYEVYEDKTNYYIVSEYCKGGELFEAIANKCSFTEKEACFIIRQLMSAICYCHQNNIVHRDLKPENVLLDEKSKDLTIKIIDWGCAKKLKNKEKLHETDGTPYYIAPEVLSGDYDEKCDVWSAGVIAYLVLCGYPPFNGKNDDEIYSAIEKGEFTYPEKEWKNTSKEIKDLLNKMLTVDPTKRPSALEVLSHPWFKKFSINSQSDVKLAKSVLKNMKNYKKNKRLEQAVVTYITSQLTTKDEKKELMKQFQEWDKNGDGVLSKDEIIEGYKNTYGTVDLTEINNIMASVDTDGNGVIDYNEFIACAFNKDKINVEKNLKICFESFDIDGSGKISVDELMTIFSKGDQAADRHVFENMIKEADKNGDGEISFPEFKIIIEKFFTNK